MTDVLEPLRQLVQRCDTHGILLANLSANEAAAILDAYDWQSLADLGEPQPDAWPWNAQRVALWRPADGMVVGRYFWDQYNKAPRPCWVARNYPRITGERANQPTHVRPLDPPPGGGDG